MICYSVCETQVRGEALVINPPTLIYLGSEVEDLNKFLDKHIFELINKLKEDDPDKIDVFFPEGFNSDGFPPGIIIRVIDKDVSSMICLHVNKHTMVVFDKSIDI